MEALLLLPCTGNGWSCHAYANTKDRICIACNHWKSCNGSHLCVLCLPGRIGIREVCKCFANHKLWVDAYRQQGIDNSALECWNSNVADLAIRNQAGPPPLPPAGSGYSMPCPTADDIHRIERRIDVIDNKLTRIEATLAEILAKISWSYW